MVQINTEAVKSIEAKQNILMRRIAKIERRLAALDTLKIRYNCGYRGILSPEEKAAKKQGR